MYIAPEQGQTTPWGQNVYVNINSLSLCPFVASLKKYLWSFLYVFFQRYIAPGRGRQPIEDKHFMTTERPFLFAHLLQVSKWSLRNLFLYTFLIILYMYIAPRQGQTNHWGHNFDVNRKLLPLRPFVAKNLFEFRFYTHFFHVIRHVYIAQGQGQTTLCGQNSGVNRKALSLCPFVASFKKISLKSDFIHIFPCDYTCIYPRGRCRQRSFAVSFFH